MRLLPSTSMSPDLAPFVLALGVQCVIMLLEPPHPPLKLQSTENKEIKKRKREKERIEEREQKHTKALSLSLSLYLSLSLWQASLCLLCFLLNSFILLQVWSQEKRKGRAKGSYQRHTTTHTFLLIRATTKGYSPSPLLTYNIRFALLFPAIPSLVLLITTLPPPPSLPSLVRLLARSHHLRIVL